MSAPHSLRNPSVAVLATIVSVSVSTAQVLPLSVTKYAVDDYVSSITAGPDGAMWFTESLTAKIGRITTGGAITTYSSPVGYSSIVPGPDGALWLTGPLSNQVGRITTSGQTAAYNLPTRDSGPANIAAGPDGALWFTESGGYKIGRIATDGAVAEFPLPKSHVSPLSITAGPDGAMWFTECCDKKIGRISLQGVITQYDLPASSSGGGRIVAGPDGALWFTECCGKIGRITTDGAITEYALPTPDHSAVALAVGPDGALWFPMDLAGTIGRITTDGAVILYSADASGDLVAVAAGPDGAMWFTSGSCQELGGCFGSVVRALPGSGLKPVVMAIGNAASYSTGAISPGENIVIFGTGVGPAAIATGANTDNIWATTAGNTRVLFDGVPAAVIYASSTQTSVMVPYGVNGHTSTSIVVEYSGVQSDPLDYAVAATAPGIYTLNQQGTGPGAIINQDGVTLNGTYTPAARGSVISVYMTGEGQTNPAGVDGAIIPPVLSALKRPVANVRARVGGIPAVVLYAGSAAGLISGLMQVNLTIPSNAPIGGAVPIVIRVGSANSQAGVTVAVN